MKTVPENPHDEGADRNIQKGSGTITYDGNVVEFTSPREAQQAGIVIVHQELNFLGHLTVAQNILSAVNI